MMRCVLRLVEHIGHVDKMSVSGCSHRRFKHQYVVSLSQTLNPG